MNKRLHPLFDGEGEIGAASVSVETPVDTGSTGTAPAQDTADPTPDSKESESSFAKRLREHSEKEVRAAREAWEKETGEKYKDYDTLKDTAEFFRERHGFNDLLSMKEEIELQRLTERAEKEQVSPAVLKRIDELEAKAAKVDDYEKQQQQNQTLQSFENGLKEFAKDKQIDGKPVDHMELWKFMHENGISKPEAAFKAMKADILEKQMETVKQDTIKEYLDSKKAPKVEGAPGTASVQAVDTRKMTWDQLDKHVVERVKAASTPQ